MKYLTVILFLMIMSVVGHAADKSKPLNMTCQDYSWSDVEVLVQPHLGDTLYTALVMQGQSANYNTSSAAQQAMDDSLPDVVKRILAALIKADC